MDVRPVDANALVAYLYKITEECIAMEDHVPEQFKAYYRGKMEAFLEVSVHVRRHTPTLDYAPVRHGEWIMVSPDGTFGVCKACNRSDHIDPLATHCRYCGALMDGGKKDV